MLANQDDRTPEQRATHRILIVGTDAFLSGWGHGLPAVSVAAWACADEVEAAKVEAWVRARGDMRRVRRVYDSPKRRYCPRGGAHVHIYVAREGVHS